MNILYVAAEVAPFVKTGGLADVAGSLPAALNKRGEDVRVVMPLYSQIQPEYRSKMTKIAEFYVYLSWRRQYVGVFEYKKDGVIHYFIDNEYYFKRNSIYGEFDDAERFAFFSKVASVLPKVIGFKPDIVHSNDWHTALTSLYIKDFCRGDQYYWNIKTVFTIHNLKYQGVFGDAILGDIIDVSGAFFNEYGIKHNGAVNCIKAGIIYSDIVTTVSKTYAEEIKHSFFGEGLENVIRQNDYKLIGIVNGIDYDVYDPATDPNIAKNYTIKTLSNKMANKKALQKLYGLPVDKNIPVIGMVGRLVAMKGLDLVRHIMEELLQQNIQVVLLGTGDREYEDSFNYFQSKYPNKVASRIYFNEKEAHLIYAGADMFAMPSMAEPCGLSQLLALRYGTIPIVRETGGLKDTVIPYNKYTGEGNGFSFANFNAHELKNVIEDAIDLYKDTDKWRLLMINALNSKNDWDESSKEYIEVYKGLLS